MRSPDRAIVVITHYQRLLNYIEPDFVHVLPGRPDRPVRRQGTGAAPRGKRLRLARSRAAVNVTTKTRRHEAPRGREVTDGTTRRTGKTHQPALAHYLAEYRGSLEQGPSQPRWVAQARESAIARFERLGFPTTRIEQWRFTSVEPIAERTFALATDGVEQAAQQARPLSAPIAHAVCVNGRFAPQLSSNLDRLPKGVQILGIEAALASQPSLLEPYLAKLSLTQTSAFTSLNTAFLRDGIVIVIPARSVIEQPIEITFASVSENGGSMSASTAADRGRRGSHRRPCSNAM